MSAPAVAVRERPILMSGPMVRPTLHGTKTQTRRVVKLLPWMQRAGISLADAWVDRGLGGGAYLKVPGPDETVHRLHCPYGEIGDRLWVRETWKLDDLAGCLYAADKASPAHFRPWRPSIFMPRRRSRITLELTGVRVERVQDISEEDARAEGATPDTSDLAGYTPYKSGFAYLWQTINGARGYGWDVNPWVWVLEFARVIP